MSDTDNTPDLTPNQPDVSANEVDIDAPLPDDGYDPGAAAEAVTARMNEIRKAAATAVSQRVGDLDDQIVDDYTEPLSEPSDSGSDQRLAGEGEDFEEPSSDEQAAASDTDADATSDEPTEGIEGILKREKQLREQRASFEEERRSHQEQMKALELAYANAKADPIAFLKAFGVDITPERAEEFLNESLGELAPPDYQQVRKLRQLEAENARLKALQEQQSQTEVQQQFAQYQNSLRQAVENVPDNFPAVRRVVEVYGPDQAFEQVWQTAQRYAQAGQVATPEQILGALDAHYAPLVGVTPENKQPADVKKPASPKSKSRPRSLRNSMQQASAPPKPIEEMSPDEQERYWRARATQAYNEAVSKGG